MESLNFSFPIDMVKKEQRIVVGIATADNIDKAGDIVDFAASLEAFKNWAGNVREMHAPIAVGKAINYQPITIQGDDGQMYNAIRVEAYISKGAQDTWEKVLDGTLQSFSIGGTILEKEMDTTKVYRGKPVKRIKKYALTELSLVDNPANPVAVIDVVKFDSSSNSLDYVLKIDCEDINLSIPSSVQRMARIGLEQRKEHGRGGTSVGMASARRLAAGGTASPEFVRKVARYFPRHEPDLRAEGANPGDDGYPSNGRIAWNLWGGTPGWVWARSKVRQLDNCTKLDPGGDLNKSCECGCGSCNDYDIMEEIRIMEKLLNDPETTPETVEDILTFVESELNLVNKSDESIDISLLNEDNYAKVSEMDTSAEQKLSLLKRFVNWLTFEEGLPSDDADVEKSITNEIASTESQVEAEDQTMEDQMDIDMIKDALGSVIDQKLTDFAASLKEEVRSDVEAKIDEVTKSFEESRNELAEKLAAAETALAEQTAKVDSFADAGAVKKSVDPEDDDEELVKSAPVQRSFWGNVYLPEGVIKTLGYES